MSRTATHRKMTQEERSQQSTDLLIKACIELASELGANSITFEAIGERAGYSRNLAFRKFGSKEGLLEAVINYLNKAVEEVRAEANLESISGLEAIFAHCEAHFSALKTKHNLRAYSVLQAAAIAESSTALALFTESNKRSGREIRKLLKRGMEDGSIRKDIDPDLVTRTIGSQLLGLSLQIVAEPGFDASKVLSEFHTALASRYGITDGVVSETGVEAAKSGA